MVTHNKIEPDGRVTITMNLKPEGSMLEQEEQISAKVTEMGRLAKTFSLKSLNTDGRAVVVENVKNTIREQ